MADLRIVFLGVDQTAAAFSSVRDQISGLGQAAIAAGAGMSAAFTAPIVGVGMLGASFADLRERAKVGFTVMLDSAQAAEGLLRDLAAFAASTPFEFKELIPQAVRLKALGFEAQQIIPILRAAGDAAALSPDAANKINRITLALGQMNTAGRVNAQDMRQLTEAGVEAWKILADALGVTDEKVREMSEKGLIPAKFAVDALVNGIENGTARVKGLGGTMDALSRTASGAWSNVKDVADQALGSLLAPALKVFADTILAIIPYLQEFATMLDGLDGSTKNFIVGIAAVVASIGPLIAAFGIAAVIFSSLATPIGIVISAFATLAAAAGFLGVAMATNIGGIRDQLSGTIGPIVSQMQAWGQAMVEGLAAGMAAGLNAIVAVINAITSLLSYWFEPHSPPKIAPGIDKWGSETMQLYLSGFQKADFSIFNDLASLVEDELRNAFANGGGFDLFGAIMGSREGIADAITQMRDFGSISEDTMGRIRDAAGPVADAVENQVRLYGELARATREVESAEKDLDRIQRERSQRLKPIDRELQAIQDQKDALEEQKALADLQKKQQSGKLKPGEADKINLDIRERQLRAQKREIERSSRDEENAAKDRVDAAKDAEKSFQDQIDAQKNFSSAIKENISLWDEFHKAAGGGGGGAGGAGKPKIPEVPNLNLPNPEEIKAKMSTIGKAFQGFFGLFSEGDPEKRIGFFNSLAEAIGQVPAEKIAIISSGIRGIIQMFQGDQAGGMERFKGAMTALGAPEIGTAIENLVGAFTRLKDTLGPILAAIPGQVAGFIGTLQTIGQIAGNVFGPLFETIGQFIGWQDILVGIGGVILAIIVPAFATFAATIAPFVLLFGALVLASATIRKAWETDFGGIRSMWEESWNTSLRPGLQLLIGWLQNELPGAIAEFKSQWAEAWPLIEGRIKTASQTIEMIFGTWKTLASGFINLVADILTKFDALKTFLEGLHLPNPFATLISNAETLIGLIDRINGKTIKAPAQGAGAAGAGGLGAGGGAIEDTDGRASGGPIDAYTPYLVHRNEVIWSRNGGSVTPAGMVTRTSGSESGPRVGAMSIAVHIPSGAVNLDGLSDAELEHLGTRVGGYVLKGFNDALESRLGGTE